MIMLEYVNTWHENYQKGLGMILHGKPGTGKTYAVFAMANKLMTIGKPVMVISSIGILNRIKDAYSSGDSEHDILKALHNASLLVIDDLGAEHYTDWSASILYKLIDDRYRTRRPMVITTNLPLADLEKKLSTDGIPRAYSRLDEVCVPIHVRWEPIRKRKGEEEKRSFRERVLNIMRGA
jgi:DNA replication protein DnaC